MIKHQISSFAASRLNILYGVNAKPEYGERLTRHWYGYCRTWFSNVAGQKPATGKIRIWDLFHKWERD